MRRARILVIGSTNTDLTVRVPRLPRPGETILGSDLATAAGGKGANQAVSAARAGGDVTFIGSVGADEFGRRALAGLRRDGIHTRHVVRDPRHASGAALVFVANNGENTIAVAPGANAHLSAPDVRQAARAFSRTDILVTQLETPLKTLIAAVELAVTRGVRVLLNPAPAQSLPHSVLRHVSILTPNETEAELLTGVKVSNPRTAARAAHILRSRGVQTVVITLGARGAFVSDEDGDRQIPGFRVKTVDTTAAGDVFNGALAVSISEGDLMTSAVRFANAAAALSVTRIGAQPSAPTRLKILRFLGRHGARTSGSWRKDSERASTM